jgi:uncharacterized membrane protein
MAEEELSRLEHQLGKLLRLGVVLSAAALGTGLVMHFARVPAGETVMRAGLILLMAIPVTRIAASFVDAVRRADRLLAFATAFVLIVMALTIVYSWELRR